VHHIGRTAFLAKFDSTGVAQWARSAGSQAYGYSITTDPCGNAWISAAYFRDSVTIDNTVLHKPIGSLDPMYVAEFSTNGTLMNNFSLPSGGDDNSGIAADSKGNFFLAGDYIPTIYPMTFGHDTLPVLSNPRKGGENIFLAKFVQEFPFDHSVLTDTGICIQTNTYLSAPPGYLLYEWNDHTNAATHAVDSLTSRYWVSCLGSCAQQSLVDTFLVRDGTIAQNTRDTTICSEQFTNFVINANVPLGADILWSNGSSAPSITVSETGTYSFSIDFGTCHVHDSVKVDTRFCDCNITMPSAFSPNADNLNDRIKPLVQNSCNITDYIFTVYNRWGQEVFKTRDPLKSWDGIFQGVPQEIGAYFYTLEYKSNTSSEKHFLKGDFILLR
jgi:gliding motility-associated-like protein